MEIHQGGADCSVPVPTPQLTLQRASLPVFNPTEKQHCPIPECFRVGRVMLRERKQVWHPAAQERSLGLLQNGWVALCRARSWTWKVPVTLLVGCSPLAGCDLWVFP